MINQLDALQDWVSETYYAAIEASKDSKHSGSFLCGYDNGTFDVLAKLQEYIDEARDHER